MLTRDELTAGTVVLTVEVPETFVRARQLLGEDWHPTYTFRIERVENDGFGMLFLSCWTEGARGGRFVYVGVLHQTKGCVRLTRQSAFPASATRVRIANRVLQALFAGRAHEIEKAGWKVRSEVVRELAGRF